MTRKKMMAFWLMLAIGVGIFYWSFRSTSWHSFFLSLRQTNQWWLLVAVGAMLAYLGLEAMVVKLFVDHQGATISFKDALRVPMVEQLGNGITPFAAGGQPMQLIALIQSGIEAGKAGSILTMKFVIFQGMIVLNFIGALLIGHDYVDDKLHAWAIVIWLGFLMHMLVIIALLLLMFWPKFADKLVQWGLNGLAWFMPQRVKEWQPLIEEKIQNFHRESKQMLKNKGLVLKAVALTFVQLMVYYLIPYFILLALGSQHINLALVLALHILIFMVISLFPIPGGVGGAEVGFSVLFAQFLPTHAALLLAMMIWRLITYYMGMFLGIFAFNIKTNYQKEQAAKKV